MSHAWSVQHQAWNKGKMDKWLPAHRAADGADGPYVMGYHTRADIPFHDNYGCNMLEYFKTFQDAPTSSTLYKSGMATSSAGQFEYDAAHDKLPTVSWIIPTSTQSEHPDYMPAAGADYVAGKIDAIASNPDLWKKTLFILNYDENDGLFDHVPPPVPPAGTAGEFVQSLPIGGGFRVPCLLISPWTLGGWVATEKFDHTSTLRLLELLTGVQTPNLSAWRRSTFGDLTSALGVGSTANPPELPDTRALLEEAEKEVETLPPPKFPGKTQTPPKQEKGTIPRPRP
ncbi:MAG: alkaline phosphatase family protein [Actinoallomurus sp.]